MTSEQVETISIPKMPPQLTAIGDRPPGKGERTNYMMFVVDTVAVKDGEGRPELSKEGEVIQQMTLTIRTTGDYIGRIYEAMLPNGKVQFALIREG